MSDRIKKIKIKQSDGTFSDYIPIGADAKNIDMNNGSNVENIVNKKIYYFKTISDLKETDYLTINDYVQILENKQTYIIDTNNENLDIDDIVLNNNTVARLVLDGYIKINEISLSDKYLFLFGKDILNWKMVYQRTNNFEYKIGDFIKDKNSNKIYKCTTAGISGDIYPSFNENSIIDGDITWTFISIPEDWKENTYYNINDSVNIQNLSYVCIKEHTSLSYDGYNIKIKNNIIYKRIDNNHELSNYPSLLLSIGYDNENKISYEGMNVSRSAIQVSNDGINFNIIDTPMLFPGQDFSPLFYKNKFYILNFNKQDNNDFGLYITQNFKDYVRIELDLNISTLDRTHVWFAQWFKDEITNKLYIIYSAQDKTNPIINENIVNLRLYKIEVEDIENFKFGTPSEIILSDNNRYDCFIITNDNTYYLFTRRYVDENDNSHEGYVEIWTSKDLELWNLQTDRINILNDSGYEAMSVVKINKNKYYMYLSKNLSYDYNRVWRIESEDLINWNYKIPILPTTLNLNEFGTVVKIDNQNALYYLYNYINTNNNSRTLIRPTNYLNLAPGKTNLYRFLNYSNNTLTILSAEDIIYHASPNVTDIEIANIESHHELPHRFFISNSNIGNDYIKYTNKGNIYLPDGLSEIYIKRDIIMEFIYDSNINKYIIASPSKEYFEKSNARKIILNEIASDNVIEELEIENECVYQVNINTSLQINSFSFKNNYQGKFTIYFLLEGNGVQHNTSLTLKNSSNSVLVTQYGENSDLVLTSEKNSNKFIPFSRSYGTGFLHLVSY